MEMILHQQLVMVEAEVVSVLLRVLPVAQRWAEDGAEASRKPLLMFSEDGDRDAVAVALEEWLRSQITNNSLAFNVICAIRAPSTAPSGRSTITWSHMLLLIATNAPGRSAAVAGSPTPICVGVRTGSYWVVSQKVESETTEQESLLLTLNLHVEMKSKKLMPMVAESRKLIDWMEKGDYDALQKKYSRTLLLSICGTVDDLMLDKYAFSFSYSKSESQEVSMKFSPTASNKKGGAFNSNKEITPNQMRSSASKMVPTFTQLMRTLDKMPEECTFLMKLLYYDDVTRSVGKAETLQNGAQRRSQALSEAMDHEKTRRSRIEVIAQKLKKSEITKLDSLLLVASLLASLQYELLKIPVRDFSEKASKGANIHFVSSKSNKSSEDDPMIVKHGGPHSVYVSAVSKSVAFLSSIGYSLLILVSRGSLGCGEEALQPLMRKIGSQTVMINHAIGATGSVSQQCKAVVQTIMHMLLPENILEVSENEGSCCSCPSSWTSIGAIISFTHVL